MTKYTTKLRQLQEYQYPLLLLFVVVQLVVTRLVIKRVFLDADVAGKEWEMLCIANVSRRRKKELE